MTVYLAIRTQDRGVAGVYASLEAAQAVAPGEWVAVAGGQHYDGRPLPVWVRNGLGHETGVDLVEAHALAP